MKQPVLRVCRKTGDCHKTEQAHHTRNTQCKNDYKSILLALPRFGMSITLFTATLFIVSIPWNHASLPRRNMVDTAVAWILTFASLVISFADLLSNLTGTNQNNAYIGLVRGVPFCLTTNWLWSLYLFAWDSRLPGYFITASQACHSLLPSGCYRALSIHWSTLDIKT